jgi:hypothetical protein
METILSSAGQTITIERSTQVLLGQPATIPHEMLNSLQRLFERRPEVSSAHLGWIDYASSDLPPHYVIGIQAESYSQNLVQEAGMTAKAFLEPTEFVDFMQLKGGDDGVTSYLQSVEPFFRR